jgi:colanic acid biosynthesis glycosyl transferase WcaI
VGRARRWTNRIADHLIITTPGMRALFAGEGIPDGRMTYLPVWTDAQRTLVSPVEGQGPGRADPPYICYAGTIGPSQGLDTLVTAMGELQRAGSPIRARIAGTGVALPALKERIRREGITNIDLLGMVPPAEVAPLVRGSVAQVVSLVADPRFTFTVPSKLFGAIGSGTPILAGLTGDARTLAEQSGMAFAYRSDDPADLVRAIGEAERLDDGARRRLAAVGWRYYTERLAPEAGLATIEAVVATMVRERGGNTINREATDRR